eukprot:2860795-Rhodomonas_salina.1
MAKGDLGVPKGNLLRQHLPGRVERMQLAAICLRLLGLAPRPARRSAPDTMSQPAVWLPPDMSHLQTCHTASHNTSQRAETRTGQTQEQHSGADDAEKERTRPAIPAPRGSDPPPPTRPPPPPCSTPPAQPTRAALVSSAQRTGRCLK